MRHFVAVAEELHFGRAALRLHIAQPPLSQSIRRLEADLGVELFDRSRRSVELTGAGKVFLAEARRTLKHADLARKMAQREASRAPETRVSFIGPALYRVLPALLIRYRAAAPEVSVRLSEAASPIQMEGILAGDFDIGFVSSGTEIRDECETLLMERTPAVAAVPGDWKLAEQKSTSLSQLAEQPFIRPPQKHTAQSSDVLNLFKQVGVMPEVVQESSQTNTTLSLVGAGVGCSLVMATAALSQPRNVKFLPLDDSISERHWELIMVWNREHIGKLAADFIATAKEYVRENILALGLADNHG
jgi:DNA-binding transcriptional LysR family regulator